MELSRLDLIILAAFFFCVIAVGLLKSRKEKTSEDYFLAGRGLKWWLIGFSLIAANISAEQFVGMSGQAAMKSIGLAVASYEWIAAITLVVVAFFFLPKFLKSGIFTIPEYLEYRYNHQSRLVMSLLMVIIYMGVTIPTVVYLGAKALKPLFAEEMGGIPINITTLSWCVGIVAGIYVAAGGLKACAWADLIQGSALIIGGAVIMVLTFMALDKPANFEGINAAAVNASLGVEEGATLAEKFTSLKESSMHMVLPRASTFLPWTALLLGIWIPNFYYWGLNQYIMQRTLGAHSLREGQRGIVFAAFLKLIIPFIVCIPGIIAFTLYSSKMQEDAMTQDSFNKPVLEAFEQAKAAPAEAKIVIPFNGDFAELHPDKAKEVLVFNAAIIGVQVSPDADLNEIRSKLVPVFAEKDDGFAKKLEEMKKDNEAKPAEEQEQLGVGDLNSEAVALATHGNLPKWKQVLEKLSGKAPDIEKQRELVGYDYDGAFPLLIRYLTPNGVRGFVLAALMGAVISSLASMLNAASTIFTMDIYREWFSKNASQTALVWVGRCCIPIGVVIGCLIAPVLADPKFKGAFAFIQEFQGFVSPGVLTIFLFGMFWRPTPRYCGVLGLVLSPIIYGILFFGWGDMAFLNRMAITVGAISAILLLISIINPLKEAIVLPEQTKIEMNWSKGSVYFGIFVTILTVALYIIFW
ncbi:MAG: sodium/solute symporter [Sedimentisphaerales bacterium]|nr:sodium/solute symporter [Sedimentisphaerales bacterium]